MPLPKRPCSFDANAIRCFVLCVCWCPITVLTVWAAPEPGDVFREYHLTGGGSNGEPGEGWKDEFVFIAHHTGERSTVGNRELHGIDLEHAIRAEMVVSHWGGHIGSENRRVIVNEHPSVALPLIQNTPTCPECYFSQQCAAACEIPLAYLKQGTNHFRMEVGDQICYSFDWGWFWVNQVVLRVYYDANQVEHPTASMRLPKSGDTLTNFSKMECEITRGEVERVEFIGKYRDFSWDGSGEFHTWHGIFWMKDPELQRNIGSATGMFPYTTWNNRWIPDQEGIEVAARIIDASGMIFMTESVENLTLNHGERRVKMYASDDVPECFGVQTGTMSCTIDIPDDLSNAFMAKLVLSTFSGGTKDREVYLNDTLLISGGWGRWHRLDFCEEYLPVSMLKPGRNTITFKADYPGEHAFEVNWPGPVLLIEFLDESSL